MFKSAIGLFVLIALLISCADNESKQPTKAEEIINRSYLASGADKVDNSTIKFRFRDKVYRAERNSGNFKLERSFNDSIGNITDVITNSSFKRYRNGIETEVADTMATKYTESVNSVHYFSVLPFGLKDKAVKSEFLGKVKIAGNNYDKVKITFDKSGGGTDFEDIFIYWFNQETSYVDFLAYQFNVNGGGLRFREAYNERFINEVRLVDYKNYKPKSDTISLRNLDLEFEKGNLELLSTIDLVKVIIN